MADIQANRSTIDNLDLSQGQEMALVANGEQQQEYLENIRANAIEAARERYGPQAEQWQANAFSELDRAFLLGFYEEPTSRPSALKANDQVLDFEEWEGRAEGNLEEIRYNLTMVDDVLQAAYTVNSSLARTVYVRQREGTWQTRGERSMDGRARAQDDEAPLDIIGTPLPIAHVDYTISAREQQQSMNFGEDIETRKARQAGRILRELEEEQMQDGWGPTVPDSHGNSVTMYGYKDSSVAITGTATGDWGTPSNVLDTIDDEILNPLETQTSENNRGPDPESQGLWLYFHPNQRSDLRAADPRGDGNMSLRQRIEQDYPYIDMRASGVLADGEVIAVTKDPRFIEVINAQSPTNLSEEVDFGLATEFKTLSCRVPFLKSTYDNIQGSVYLTGA
jgi:hypothetical protein